MRDYSLENETAVQTHVTHYEYDPCGAVLSVTHKTGDTFGSINPIRYKGYYYDTNLEWYNLGARYYDPSVGRFLNADDLSLLMETEGDITDKNLYSYCDNNPIMRADDDGEFWHILIGAAVNVAVDAACSLAAGEKITPYSIAVSAVSGAIGASGVTYLKFAVNIGIGVYSGVSTYKKNGGQIGKALLSGTISAGTSFAGKKVDKFIKTPNKSKLGKNIRSWASKHPKNKGVRFTKWMNRHSSKKQRYNAYYGTRLFWGGKVISHYYTHKRRK